MLQPSLVIPKEGQEFIWLERIEQVIGSRCYVAK